MRSELSQQVVTNTTSTENVTPKPDNNQPIVINEENVTQNIDGQVTETTNEVDSTVSKPKVPRVKKPS